MWKALLTLATLLLAGCGGSSPPREPLERAVWVWGRSDAPSRQERESLRTAGVSRVYWQTGELSHRAGRVRELASFPLPEASEGDGLAWIPVIRIDAKTRLPEDLPAAEVARWARDAGMGTEVQFDYDCADRRLPGYARWLREFRESAGVRTLSTTALAGWSRVPGWREVEKSIDAACPMLYDALPERSYAGGGEPDAMPLAEEAYLTGLLRDWSRNCRVPWHAGLPNFTRLSLFRDGKPQGQVRSWTWEALHDPGQWARLPPEDKASPGTVFLEARRALVLGGVAIRQGDHLAVKQADAGALRAALRALPGSTARGVVWFQMPRPGLASSGWSLPMLASDLAGDTRLRLRLEGPLFVLENLGTGDLPPSPPEGHTLRLSIEPGAVREALAGQFLSMETWREGRPVPAAFATEVRLRFPALPAGGSLRSGAVAPPSTTNIPLVRAASLHDRPVEFSP